jgi:general secretion pathway protein H
MCSTPDSLWLPIDRRTDHERHARNSQHQRAGAMKSSSESGFTLAEVLVVMAILALAAAIALPSLKAGESGRTVTLLTHKIASILQENRLKSIGQNRTVSVKYDPVDRTFTMDSADVVTVPQDMELELLTARGVSFGGDPSFRFFPDGSSTGGSVSIRKGNSMGVVKVRWLTDQIDVQRQAQ